MELNTGRYSKQWLLCHTRDFLCTIERHPLVSSWYLWWKTGEITPSSWYRLLWAIEHCWGCHHKNERGHCARYMHMHSLSILFRWLMQSRKVTVSYRHILDRTQQEKNSAKPHWLYSWFRRLAYSRDCSEHSIPLRKGSTLFSRTSLASVPSSIKSSLVMTPMVLWPETEVT